jgi:hypothetical protein
MRTRPDTVIKEARGSASVLAISSGAAVALQARRGRRLTRPTVGETGFDYVLSLAWSADGTLLATGSTGSVEL